MSLDVRWVTDEQEFLALEAGWEPLAERAATPFARHEWFRALWESYRDRLEPAVLTLSDGAGLRAALPLQRRGRALAALATEHTPMYVPLAADDAALDELLSHAIAAAPELVLPLPGELARGAFADVAARHGRGFWPEPWVQSPVIDLTAGWDAYRKNVSKNSRKEAERRARRLEEAGGTIAPLVPPVDLGSELEEGLRLEASGWKGAAGTAILCDPADAAFYRRLAELFHARGSLFFTWLHVEGRPIEFGFNLVDFDCVWTLKVGIDDDAKNFAPGIVATYYEVKAACELGLEWYEMLGDAEPWKLRFVDGTREHVYARTYSRAPLPLARLGYRRFVRPRLKDAYKRVRRR